jgi:hypothetical protein
VRSGSHPEMSAARLPLLVISATLPSSCPQDCLSSGPPAAAEGVRWNANRGVGLFGERGLRRAASAPSKRQRSSPPSVSRQSHRASAQAHFATTSPAYTIPIKLRHHTSFFSQHRSIASVARRHTSYDASHASQSATAATSAKPGERGCPARGDVTVTVATPQGRRVANNGTYVS